MNPQPPIILTRPLHFGDPCVHCKTPHDEVKPGPCPAFEPFPRPPMAGEEFLTARGREYARFDFEAQAFAIFKAAYRTSDRGVERSGGNGGT